MEPDIDTEQLMEVCNILAESNLSLHEMGALVNFLSMLSGTDDPRVLERAQSQEMIGIASSLYKKGVIKYAKNDRNISVQFDIEAA
jgi:hypothetical protein